MTDDTSILTAWSAFAASAPGFLGHTLHLHRQRTGLSLAQQRALLGLHDASTDALWTRLQAMPLPRPQHFDADLHRIVAHVLTSSPHSTIHTSLLAAFLHAHVVFFLISAMRVLFYMNDLDELPPTWEVHLNRVGPWLAFGIGALWLLVSIKLWMFTLSAIGIINSADLGTLPRLLFYTFYLLGSQILIGLPIVLCIILPDRSASILKAWSDLLTKYYRPIIISISSIFSLYFLWHGLYKLFT